MATRERILRVRELAKNLRFWRVLARIADICQTVLRRLARLARLADIRQTVLRGLARLAKGKFGKCYANLASLANLVSVG